MTRIPFTALALLLLATSGTAAQMGYLPRNPPTYASLDAVAELAERLQGPAERSEVCGRHPAAVAARMVRTGSSTLPCDPPGPESVSVTPLAGGPAVTGFASATWQGELLVALAALVERSARATIEAYGVEQARALLCTGEGRAYLPVSCNLLNAIDPYLSRVPWSAAAGGFRADLRMLPVRLVKERLDGRDSIQGAVTVAALTQAIVLLERGDNLPAILEGARLAMSGVGIGLEGVDRVLVDWLELAVMVTRPTDLPESSWRTSAAAMYEEIWSEPADAAVVDALWALRQGASDIQSLADRARQARRTAAPDGDQASHTAAFNAYVSAVIGLLHHIPRTVPGSRLADPQVAARFDAVTRGMESIDRALAGVRAGAYSVALAEAVSAISVIASDWQPGTLVRFASFGAELAEARTADEMGVVLSGLATPPGGFKAKRRASMLGFNAYLGGQGSLECGDQEDCGGFPDRTAFGAFMPVGLESSWAIGRNTSLGAFLSLIDIGQLLSVRKDPTVAEDSTGVVETEPRIGLRQVMSPGLFLTLAPFDLPVALGIGASVAPQLRSVDTDGETEGMSVVRALVFVAVDVPLYRFR